MSKKAIKANKTETQARPPVVVIMGHVDHGKTSILDYIRKAKVIDKTARSEPHSVAEQESGGITQHIGAYQVEHQGKLITFIDTPGHEAFSAMRSRGAKVADVGILVVAADDGVMPQTKEAIDHIKHASIPMIVAINKIDKPSADSMKIKNQLLESEIVVEDLKGKVPSVEVSAKNGQGIDDLLETINLVAELEELTSDILTKAEGVVIEAEMDHRRGPVATLLVKEGVLRAGQAVYLPSAFGKVKAMEDFQGKAVLEAGPGTPVLVAGLASVPLVGDRFKEVADIEQAEKEMKADSRRYAKEGEVIEVSADTKIVNVVLKADVQGTLEAAREIIKEIKGEGIMVRVLNQSVGEISESDIKLAAAANALLVGFRTKLSHAAEGFAKQMKVEVVASDIIYELVGKVRGKIVELISAKEEEVIIGELKVLAIFRTEKTRIIVGGKVQDGVMRRGVKVHIIRPGGGDVSDAEGSAETDSVVGEGRIAQVKVGEKVADKPVEKGQECGILFEGDVKVLVGDRIQAYEIQHNKVQL